METPQPTAKTAQKKPKLLDLTRWINTSVHSILPIRSFVQCLRIITVHPPNPPAGFYDRIEAWRAMKPGEISNKCCQNLREGELLRLIEVLRLRVKEIDFTYRKIEWVVCLLEYIISFHRG
jgi:hypothetical protein